jgi:hypothetical protein
MYNEVIYKAGDRQVLNRTVEDNALFFKNRAEEILHVIP